LIAASAVAVASTAQAQACVGAPSFSAGAARLGANVVFGDHVKTYGGQLTLGTWNGFFVSGDYAHAKQDSTDGSSNAGGGSVGYEYKVSDNVMFCPMAAVHAQTGSVVGNTPSAPMNTVDWNLGGSLGWVAAQSGGMEVIPAVGAFFASRSMKAIIATQGQSNPTTTDGYGLFTGAIGFVFNKAWTLTPSVQVPVSQDNGKTSFGIGLSYNFSPSKLW
jgi:hypothetical protein